MTNPRDELMAPEIDLHTYCGADARRWAEAFSQIKARQGWSVDDIDTDLMIGWFANAIEVACAIRLAASRPAPVDREAVARAICQTGKFETGEGTCALLCMDQLGSPRKKGCCHSARVHGKLADSILSLLRPAEPAEAALGGWTYEIQHGPDGEAAYAWVYDEEHFLVCTAKIHHAKMIVARMNDAPPKSPDTSAAVLAERERCAAIADEWANKMARNHGRETANTIAAAIRQLPTESKP